MNLRFQPQRRDDHLELERKGDALIINGAEFDFANVEDGGRLTPAEAECPWLAEDVMRENGVLDVTLFLPLGPNAPEERRYPLPIAVSSDGPIGLPDYGPLAGEETENPDL